MQLHEPGEESPLEKASPGKENLTAFERASQEIEMASQELRPLPADPAAAEARDSGAAARSEEAEQAAAHEEAADGVPAMTEKSVTVEERHPTIGWHRSPLLGVSVKWWLHGTRTARNDKVLQDAGDEVLCGKMLKTARKPTVGKTQLGLKTHQRDM